jgi:hypothetical protein
VRPVDEAGRDRTLVVFRKALREIVNRKDAAGLVRVLAPQIVTNFGDDSSNVADFQRRWRPGNADSEVWKVLADVLEMGGVFRGATRPPTFCAPYVFGAFPREVDSFRYVAVTGSGVALRGDPWDDAPVTTSLYYDVVRPISDRRRPVRSPGVEWLKVELPTGVQGWIPASTVRSPIDYRACFRKTPAGWRISALVSGD